MAYSPPTNIFEVNQKLHFDEPLEKGDPRFVDMAEARGEFSFDKLHRMLGLNIDDPASNSIPDKNYILFCGHRGCGKSTELRRLTQFYDHEERFFVIFVDIGAKLDPNNLEYVDVFMALAAELAIRLEESKIEVEQIFLTNLQNWFEEKIEKHEKIKSYSAELTSGAEGKTGLPFIGSVFAKLSASIKTNSTYKEEIRRAVQNSFSEFAGAFQQFLDAAERKVIEAGIGQKLLFVLDGADRLSYENSQKFFINDVNQLQSIRANFIYCSPISLLYEANQVQQVFQHFVLPMIKLHEKNDEKPLKKGYQTLRDMLFLRADISLFDSEKTADILIRFSGGCPRELLRLLGYAFQWSETNTFDKASALKAVEKLSVDYKRFLSLPDYEYLAKQDQGKKVDTNSEQAQNLLYNLALMEYNNFWRHSHPVIQELDGYQSFKKSGKTAKKATKKSGKKTVKKVAKKAARKKSK